MEKDELAVLIPSGTVRNYVLETGWEFTDRQKAAILYHRDEPCSAARKALYALRDSTGDAVLKRQLTEYLGREEKALALLKENGDGNSFYILQYGDEERGYFADYETAVRFGMDTKSSFMIEKHLLASEKTLGQFQDGAYFDFPEEIAGFNEYGEIDFLESIILDPAEWDAEDEWHERFENMFYEVPNPFERGDIVKKAGSEEYGVVEDSQEDWRKLLERSKTSEPGFGSDFSEVQIRVAFPDEEGIFYHEYVNPVCLERYEPECTDETEEEDRIRAARDRLLILAGEMCRGSGSLEDWQFAVEQYRLAVNEQY